MKADREDVKPSQFKKDIVQFLILRLCLFHFL